MTEPAAPYTVTTVRCVDCGRILNKKRLLPGMDDRYRCQGCGHWTRLIVVGPNGEGLPIEAVEVAPLTAAEAADTMA